MSQHLALLSNADLCEHLRTLEAGESAMSIRQERVRNQIDAIDDPDGTGAAACDSLRDEDREISERRSLLQEQIAELHLERSQRLTSLKSRRRAA